jgi:hypothetical protein
MEGIGGPADKRESHALPRLSMGAAWEADLAERKNTGLAVPDAKRLNDCYHELSEAIAARPPAHGDRNLWQYDYAALPGGPEGNEREAWNHRCGSKDVALVALRPAVASGNLQLWAYGPHGEREVDRYELKELTFRTFESGTYQPNNRISDTAGLADRPLWVKEADWQRFMLDLWAVRYGLDWANPAPPAEPPKLPPESPFIMLSEALTWIAFRVSMARDHLHEVLSLESYGGRVPQEAIKDAVAQLTALGSDGKVALRGKYQPSPNDDEKLLLTAKIDPIKLEDYRLFSYLEDELGYGEGLLFWRNADSSIIDRILGSGRKDSFLQVKVSRTDLLREFPPRMPLQVEGFRFLPGHNYTRDDPADTSPWWTVNQALAWIASRIPSYVDYAGKLEAEYCGRQPHVGRLMAHVTIEDDMSRCDEASTFMLERRANWPEGSVLAHAGRALLGKILAREIAPRAREDGRGRAMQHEEFVGVGTVETGADWLDIEPQPLFSSAQMMAAFPSDSTPIVKAPEPLKRRKGRAPGTGFQRADAPLIEAMRAAIDGDPSLNPTSAARLFADQAKGASFEAKVDRLARSYRAGRNGA